jgi:hypothetical protein
MPTILREDGYDIQIYTQDHLPPHVHVFARGCEAILNLNCPDGEIGVRENFRFKARELSDIKRILKKYQSLLCAVWKEIHDDLG